MISRESPSPCNLEPVRTASTEVYPIIYKLTIYYALAPRFSLLIHHDHGVAGSKEFAASFGVKAIANNPGGGGFGIKQYTASGCIRVTFRGSSIEQEKWRKSCTNQIGLWARMHREHCYPYHFWNVLLWP